jgi:hypothetical protein
MSDQIVYNYAFQQHGQVIQLDCLKYCFQAFYTPESAWTISELRRRCLEAQATESKVPSAVPTYPDGRELKLLFLCVKQVLEFVGESPAELLGPLGISTLSKVYFIPYPRCLSPT